MSSDNRSQQQQQQQETWPIDNSALPVVIPPDSTTSNDSPSPSSSAASSSFISRPSATLDVSSITGNISDQAKRHVMNMLSYYTGTKEESFGVEIARRLRMRSMNVWATSPGRTSTGRISRKATEAQTVFDITVTKDMCNPYGTLHGACACYIVDPCSMSAIVVLGAALGVDATGVSQSMNLIWHRPAKLGTKLRAVSTSIFIEGRIRTARVEIMDEETDKLYVSAIHSTLGPKPDPQRGRLSKL